MIGIEITRETPKRRAVIDAQDALCTAALRLAFSGGGGLRWRIDLYLAAQAYTEAINDYASDPE